MKGVSKHKSNTANTTKTKRATVPVRNTKRHSNSKNHRNIESIASKMVSEKQEELKSDITRWLGGAASVKRNIYNDFDVIKASETGLSKASIENLGKSIGVSKKDMAEEILNISIKTLERKGPSDKLEKKISSHALEVAKVMQHTYEVFEEEERARQWLNRENRALNGAKPVQLLDTLTGINMVNEILTRIEEGVYS